MASSGHLGADRRYEWGRGALDSGDLEGAADLARQTIELAPDFAAGWFLLGEAEERAGAHDAARAAYAEARARDPADSLGAGIRLAQLGAGDPATAMTPAYVRDLFDGYAPRFERHLVGALNYRGPALLHAALRRTCDRRVRPFAFAATLDLGCGTGLAGEAFRAATHHLAGIDLAPAMVKRAARKRIYDELATGDAALWLAGRDAASVDLVIAADVFVYVADLAPVFAAAARVLRPGGLFAFTAETHDGAGIALGAGGRYAHAAAYLRETAEAAGLAVALLEEAPCRQQNGHDVPGWVMVLRA